MSGACVAVLLHLVSVSSVSDRLFLLCGFLLFPFSSHWSVFFGRFDSSFSNRLFSFLFCCVPVSCDIWAPPPHVFFFFRIVLFFIFLFAALIRVGTYSLLVSGFSLVSYVSGCFLLRLVVLFAPVSPRCSLSSAFACIFPVVLVIVVVFVLLPLRVAALLGYIQFCPHCSCFLVFIRCYCCCGCFLFRYSCFCPFWCCLLCAFFFFSVSF